MSTENPRSVPVERIDELLRAIPGPKRPSDAELHAYLARNASVVSGRPAFLDLLTRLADGLTTEGARKAWVIALLATLFSFAIFRIHSYSSTISHAPQEQVYETNQGSQYAVALKDGSLVKLGGATRIGVVLSARSRQVTLYKGEAMFKVAHNSSIPFRVYVGAALVTDLGTTFHVRLYSFDKQVIVGVTEGAVVVATRARDVADDGSGGRFVQSARSRTVTVGVGQAVSSDATGVIGPVHAADFTAATWWGANRRTYQGKPLGRVIQDLQLYSARRIECDSRAATLPYSGVVDPNQIEEWVRGLELILPVRIDDSNEQRLYIGCRQADCGQ